jgi:DNA-binding PadR family transcriptional regulator
MGKGEEFYELEISRRTGLKAGTIHPILSKLEVAGFVTERWEEGAVWLIHMPRRSRHYYKLNQAKKSYTESLDSN